MQKYQDHTNAKTNKLKTLILQLKNAHVAVNFHIIFAILDNLMSFKTLEGRKAIEIHAPFLHLSQLKPLIPEANLLFLPQRCLT